MRIANRTAWAWVGLPHSMRGSRRSLKIHAYTAGIGTACRKMTMRERTQMWLRLKKDRAAKKKPFKQNLAKLRRIIKGRNKSCS